MQVANSKTMLTWPEVKISPVLKFIMCAVHVAVITLLTHLSQCAADSVAIASYTRNVNANCSNMKLVEQSRNKRDYLS